MEIIIRYLRHLKRKAWFNRLFGFYLELRAARLDRPYKTYSAVVTAGRVQLQPYNLGARFWVHARSDLAKRVILGGVYEPELCEIIRRVWRGPGKVVNVGANVGFWSIGLLNLVPDIQRVLAIEPNPDALELLRENIALNDVGDRVFPIQACVAETEGSIEFETVQDMPEYSSIGRIIHPAVSGKARVRIPVAARPLGKILGEEAHGIRMILIDTEGAEYLVLAGARDVLITYRPVVIFECYNPYLGNFGHSVAMVRQLLKGCGYVVRNAEPPHNLLPDDFEGEALAYPEDDVPPGF
jgi:FkbM family methyltransferase